MKEVKQRLYKCYGSCEQKYTKDQLIEHVKGKRYCEKCLNELIREQKDREELYQTIQTLYNVNFPTGMMLKQISQYKDEQKQII